MQEATYADDVSQAVAPPTVKGWGGVLIVISVAFGIHLISLLLPPRPNFFLSLQLNHSEHVILWDTDPIHIHRRGEI